MTANLLLKMKKRKHFLLGTRREEKEDVKSSSITADTAADSDPCLLKMHHLNPYYLKKPDFKNLSEKYPDIVDSSLLISNHNGSLTFDWTNPASNQALTTALLLDDFNITGFELPPNRLCPPVPNRVNYVCWIQELISLQPVTVGPADTSLDHSTVASINPHTQADIDDPPRVLDIGVGASCIYPLLGHRLFGWTCVGSDIDHISISNSKRIVSKNHLEQFIEIVSVDPCSELQAVLLQHVQYFLECKPEDVAENSGDGHTFSDEKLSPLSSFLRSTTLSGAQCRGPVLRALEASHTDQALTACMTNPPFYDVCEDVETSLFSTCTGSRAEMYTEGGEYAFGLSIILDSIKLRRRVMWYSTMLGKKRTLKKLLRVLREEGIRNVHSTRFVQGSATVRWGLAWSFYELYPREPGTSHPLTDSRYGLVRSTPVLSKVFGSRKKNVENENFILKVINKMSVDNFIKTSSKFELQFVSKMFSKERSEKMVWKNETVLSVDCLQAFENYLRTRELSGTTLPTSSDVGHMNSGAIAHINSSEGTSGDDDSINLKSYVSLLCLSIKRIEVALNAFSEVDASATRWILNCSRVEVLSRCSVTMPLLTTPLEELRYWVQVTISDSSDALDREVQASIKAEVSPSQTLTSEMRCIFFKFADFLEAEWQRKNRRWRRKLSIEL